MAPAMLTINYQPSTINLMRAGAREDLIFQEVKVWDPDRPSQEHSDPQQPHRPPASLTWRYSLTGRRKPYEVLTDDEKWYWHADNYAFRHAVLHEPLQTPSPCDPTCQWFDENLVRDAIARKYPPKPRNYAEELAGRGVADAWAKERGFADMTAALEAGRTYAEVVRSILNFEA